MTYKDELQNATQSQPEADNDYSISEDIKQVFNDDTLFGELLTQTVGEVVGNLSEKVIESLQEKLTETLQSDEFSGRLGDQLGWKDVERPQIETGSPEREDEAITR